MNQNLEIQKEERVSEIAVAFNKIEAELNNLYERSMINLMCKPVISAEAKKEEKPYKRSFFRQIWASILSLL